MTCAQQLFCCAAWRSAWLSDVHAAGRLLSFSFNWKLQLTCSVLNFETPMCDNFKGWVNFSNGTLGIDTKHSLQHATGISYSFIMNDPDSYDVHSRYCCWQIYVSQVLFKQGQRMKTTTIWWLMYALVKLKNVVLSKFLTLKQRRNFFRIGQGYFSYNCTNFLLEITQSILAILR